MLACLDNGVDNELRTHILAERRHRASAMRNTIVASVKRPKLISQISAMDLGPYLSAEIRSRSLGGCLAAVPLLPFVVATCGAQGCAASDVGVAVVAGAPEWAAGLRA